MTIVSVPELVDYMSNVTLTADQLEAAELVLEGVQGELEVYLNRPVEPREVTEVLQSLDGYVRPRITPVVQVLSVTGLATVPLYSKANGLYVGWAGEWSVTYRAGIDGASKPDIRLAILRVAAREMQNRHDDTLSVKDLRTDDEKQNPRYPEGWQEAELMRLSRYRRRVIT